jgi:hypothetical protein
VSGLVVADDTQQHLGWEARQRPRAAVAAILGALLSLAAELWSAAIFRDAPRIPFVRSLQHALQPGPLGSSPSLRTPFYTFYDAHAGALLGASVIRALGYVGIAWALAFLAVATRARRPELPRLALYLPVVGGLLVAISVLMGTIGSSTAVSDFLSGARSVDAAQDIGRNTLIVTAGFVGLAGSLALASSFVLVALNAMRTGLLTRAMGIMGILVGVLIIFPIGLIAVIIQNVWLLAVGVLLLSFWPQGVPPAWRTGRAEPWPSMRRPPQGGASPAQSEAPAAVASKRKRKRRT